MDASNITALEHLQKEITSSIRWDLNVVKPIEKDKFHFTILFLGEIHKDIIKNITEKLLRVEFESFKIFTTPSGHFLTRTYLELYGLGLTMMEKRR